MPNFLQGVACRQATNKKCCILIQIDGNEGKVPFLRIAINYFHNEEGGGAWFLDRNCRVWNASVREEGK